MSKFGDFRTAQQLDSRIREIVAQEIAKQRPPERYAVVDSINAEDRSVMATFIGDDVSVRIPYLDTIPSEVGQEVRVGGVGADRVITGIRGTSDTGARAAGLEAELALRTVRFAEWHRGGGLTIPEGLVTLTWTVTPFPPVGFGALAFGETRIVIPEDAYYRVSGQITFSGDSDFVRDIYVQVLPTSGAANYDIIWVKYDADADGQSVTGVSMTLGPRVRYLYAGDEIRVNIGSEAEFGVFGGILSYIAIEKVYGGPMVEAAT